MITCACGKCHTKGFEYRCICDWSKDDVYGFIPKTICPVHGKDLQIQLNKMGVKNEKSI